MATSLKNIMGIIFLMLSPFLVQAQFLDPVSFEVIDSPEKVEAGERFEITVRAEIEGKWHLYSIANAPDAGPYPTQFSSNSDLVQIAGEVQESEPEIEFDPNFGVDLGWHTSEATFTIPLAFQKDAEGEAPVDLEVLYQVCDDKSCLPPKTKIITRVVEVSGVASQPHESSNGSSDAGIAEQTEETAKIEAGTTASGLTGDGMWSFLWLALTAGFAALLTPCVFPMIPLTVSFFSKQNEGTQRRAVGQAMGFGIAIVITFTILGALLSLLIGAAGANQFAANPWVNLLIGVVLIVFALSLLGAFELRLPYQLTNWLNRKSNESAGISGILFMALTISAVSFSCTAPFVGAVLAATTGGEWFYPILGMVGFSAAFASPFVLFALFPRWLEALPQSGSWMNVVKVLLGFIELAAAVKFISNADLVWSWGIVSRPFAIATWIAIFLLAGLYTLGVFAMKHETKPEKIGTGRLMLSLPFLLFSFYLIPGLLGASLGIWDAWLPPKQATDISVVASIGTRSGSVTDADEGWSDDYEASLQKAQEKSRLVFVDFTGYTCTNCRAMESNVFPLASVQEKFEQMELVRLYTDGGENGPQNQRFQFEFTGTVALPTYVVVNPHTGRIVEQLIGYADKDKFNRFLKESIIKFKSEDQVGAL